MQKPNLFKFATSELSQDAFICWLLSWASPLYSESNPGLHKCGKELISSFFEKHGEILPDIYKVNVIKQDSNIDVLCIVNDKYAILIEDKTNTKNHSGQLKKYLSDIQSRKEEYIVIPIYFKTYDQSNYKSVEENNYKIFSRIDFLNILSFGENLGISDSIFMDFNDHLQTIEDRVQSYLLLPKDKWSKSAWTGFFLRLQKDFCAQANWDYVPNKSGGFMGFWWQKNKDIYLQLEANKLCFKIYVPEGCNQKQIRTKYYNLINHSPKPSNLNSDITRPKRFGKGKHMTVMEIKEYRKFSDSGNIDVEQTILYLKSVELFIAQILESKV